MNQTLMTKEMKKITYNRALGAKHKLQTKQEQLGDVNLFL